MSSPNIALFTAPQVYIFPQQPLLPGDLASYELLKQSNPTYKIVDFFDKRNLFRNIDYQLAAYNSEPARWDRHVEICKKALATPSGQYFKGLIQPILCKNAFYFLQTPTGELQPVAFCKINCPYIHSLALQAAIDQSDVAQNSLPFQEAPLEAPLDSQPVENVSLNDLSSQEAAAQASSDPEPVENVSLSSPSSMPVDSPLSEMDASNSNSPSHILGSSPSSLELQPDPNTLSPNDPPLSPTTPPKALSKGAAIVPPKTRKGVVVLKKE